MNNGLYNGNIRHSVVSLVKINNETMGYVYSYDQLNRLNGQTELLTLSIGNDATLGKKNLYDWLEENSGGSNLSIHLEYIDVKGTDDLGGKSSITYNIQYSSYYYLESIGPL
jgi:hypothetical protein